MDNHLYKGCWSNIFEANSLYFFYLAIKAKYTKVAGDAIR
jgi:hypothetical protein